MRSPEFYRALGKRITELRKAFEMTQAELARALQVSQNTVFRWELGDRRVTLDRLPALMQVFGISCEQLLGLQPLQPPARTLSAAELRHVEQVRQLAPADRRVVKRVAEALRQ